VRSDGAIAYIHNVDRDLEGYGYYRVGTSSPDNTVTGTATYVRKPCIAMSTLGRNGRFGNQLFQYAFLATYARRHDLRIETPRWIGRELFGLNDPPQSRLWPTVYDWSNRVDEALMPNLDRVLGNVNVWGWFQYHTSYYAFGKNHLRSLFRPVPSVREEMERRMRKLRARGRTLFGVHMRRGDYGYGRFVPALVQWYLTWLAEVWPQLSEPVLYLATDDPETVAPAFAAYRPVVSGDIGAEWKQASYYPDFYALMSCDLLAVSNSSFSIAASMLNERAALFVRPDRSTGGLRGCDPWNTEVLLEPDPPQALSPMSSRAEDFIRELTELVEEGSIREALAFYDTNRGSHSLDRENGPRVDSLVAKVRLCYYRRNDPAPAGAG
jgi:hypothetical protein